MLTLIHSIDGGAYLGTLDAEPAAERLGMPAG
jgi:hypothetical protein